MRGVRALAPGSAVAFLGTAALRRLRPFPVRVAGASMEPGLRDGDRLVVSPELAPRVGDVVVVRARGTEMVKRLTALSESGAVLEGDNRAFSTNLVVAGGDIVGVAFARYAPRPALLRRR